jgi:calcineurin-like phosphoesterase
MGVFSFVKAGGKKFGSIVGTKPNVPKTKVEKLKSKLAIATQKTKASKAKLNQTLFNIDQASKKAKETAKHKRNEKIVKKFIGEK